MTKDSLPEKPDERADAPPETAASKYRRRQLERQLGPTQFLDEPPPYARGPAWVSSSTRDESARRNARSWDTNTIVPS